MTDIRTPPRTRPTLPPDRALALDQALLIELEPEAGRLYDRHAQRRAGVVPPRLHPVPARARLRQGAVDTGPAAPDRRRPDGLRDRPPDRGQPALVPPAHPRDVRQRRRRVDQLGRALDRRGGSPRHRPARLPDGHPQHRPDPPRARADDPAPAGLRRTTRHRPCAGWPTWPSRSSRRASRTATRAATRTTPSPTGSWSASPPTRTCTWSSTATSWPPPSSSSRRPRCAPSSTRSWPSRCPAPASRASCARPPRSRRPASTTCAVHRDEVLLPILRHWRIFELEGLDGAAEEARRRLAEHLEQLDVAAKRFEAKLASSTVPRIASAG